MLPQLESALIALARLDEALAQSPFADAWFWQARVGSALRATADDGLKIDRGQFLVARADMPVHPEARDSEALAEAVLAFEAAELGFGRRAPETDDEHLTRDAILSIAETLLRAVKDPARSRLEAVVQKLRTLDTGHRNALQAPALALAIRDCGLTRHLLPGIGRPREAGKNDEGAALLRSIEKDALAGHAELMAIGHVVARWRRQLAARDDRRGVTRRSSSRAPALLPHLLCTPVVTPDIVAALLGVTRRGAAMLLEDLEAAEIVRRADPGLRWRAFVPSCHADVADAIHVSRGWS